jgi:hypothetical protein
MGMMLVPAKLWAEMNYFLAHPLSIRYLGEQNNEMETIDGPR